jgi:hypothetical protein
VGIRETLNQNPGITTGVTAGIIVLALAVIIWQSFDRGPRIPNQAFFTVDDGQTWFADDINRVPPFQHNGQEAVRAHVFTCDGGRTKFVAYLEKYSDQAKARLERMRTQAQQQQDGMMDPAMYEDVMMTGTMVRKPGDPAGRWVPQMNWDLAGRITEIRCPDGTTQNIQPVMP